MAQPEPDQFTHNDHANKNRHSAEEVTYINVPEGQLMLLICSECRFIETHCLHLNNSWNKEKTVLTCNLCGWNASDIRGILKTMLDAQYNPGLSVLKQHLTEQELDALRDVRHKRPS